MVRDAGGEAKVDEFDKKLTERLDDSNFILIPGDNNFHFEDDYSIFPEPAGDPAYGGNEPTKVEYGSMATESKPDGDNAPDNPDVYDK